MRMIWSRRVLSAVKDISRILFQLTGIVFVGVVQDREQDEYLIRVTFLASATPSFCFFAKLQVGIIFLQAQQNES